MSLATRLQRLEAAAHVRGVQAMVLPLRTDAERLDLFRSQGAVGMFGRVPDFGKALADGDLDGLLAIVARTPERIAPASRQERSKPRPWVDVDDERLWEAVTDFRIA